MENATPNKPFVKMLRRIAVICGAFTSILCILIIANYIQLKRVDPLNTPAMTTLLERLKYNPGDDSLRVEIRELDLLSRKAFFTSQWQIRMGGYILLASLLIVIICLKWIELIRPKIPPFPEPVKETFWDRRKINRRWIAYTGIFLVAGSLLLAFLTYKELGKTLIKQQAALVSQADSLAQQGEEELQNQVISAKKYLSRQEILNNSVTFRGPEGNGIVAQKNFPVSWNGKTGNHIAWKTEIPLPGYNSPVIWNDRVFLSGANATKREVYCFDAGTGKILWKTDVSNVPGTPGTVPKVDPQTGLAAPTMTTDGQRVYAIFATGDLVALGMDGNRVWAKNLGLPKNHYGHSSSLVMYRDLIIVQFDQHTGSSVMAFAGETGEQVWKAARNVRVSWASPVLVNTGNRMELLLVADPVVTSYDPATGKELWQVDCISGEVGPSAAYADGMVFSVNEYAKLAAIKLGETPQVIWESTDYLSDIPSPVAGNNCLFLATSYGAFVCYDAKTGRELWVKELNNPTYASPMLVDGNIYQLDKTGIMHIFRADSAGTPVAESPLGEGSVCTPAFSGGKIYIRGERNLYCIGN
ncbi:MAG: PQQ-binding-like beta-propeller repeat protein [bacterium]